MIISASQMFVICSPGDYGSAVSCNRERIFTDRALAEAEAAATNARYRNLNQYVDTLDNFIDDLRSESKMIGEYNNRE
jgi:hypothetical protein